MTSCSTSSRRLCRGELVAIDARGETDNRVAGEREIDMRTEVLAEQRIAPPREKRVAAMEFEICHLPLAHLECQARRFDSHPHWPEERVLVAARIAREWEPGRRRALHRLHRALR